MKTFIAAASLFLVLLLLCLLQLPVNEVMTSMTTVMNATKNVTPSAVEQQSSCSGNATARGPGQRVVSFCFYGKKNNLRRYFQGIEGNAQLVAEIYPGWLMRVYHNMDADDPDLQRLAAKFPHLDFCDVTRLPGIGSLADKQPNTWRFLPLCDPLVDAFLSRDLDSRVSPRERAAVDEWLVSGLHVHAMRDHPLHNVPLLAGMWGARLVGDDRGLRRLCEGLTRFPAQDTSADQRLLWSVLWPHVKGDVMQHDAYSCVVYNSSHGNAHAWPTRRLYHNGNFVGCPDGQFQRPLMDECPKACRPRDHGDWTSC